MDSRNRQAGFSARGSFIGLLAILVAIWLLAGPGAAEARSRLKSVGYVDGYRQAEQASAEDPSLSYRHYVAWARERLKRLKPYPRGYVEGFEEGARDFFRKRRMDHRADEVDFSLRPEGALEALAAPE